MGKYKESLILLLFLHSRRVLISGFSLIFGIWQLLAHHLLIFLFLIRRMLRQSAQSLLCASTFSSAERCRRQPLGQRCLRSKPNPFGVCFAKQSRNPSEAEWGSEARSMRAKLPNGAERVVQLLAGRRPAFPKESCFCAAKAVLCAAKLQPKAAINTTCSRKGALAPSLRSNVALIGCEAAHNPRNDEALGAKPR